MYYRLSEALKERMISELQRFWRYHPKYRDIVDNIQGKYSFDERPQRGIVLKTSSGTQVRLAADNFQGTVLSHVFVAKVGNKPGLAVEWVKEDSRALQNNNGVFPCPPGIYYIEITSTTESGGEFWVDPLLEIVNESVTKIDDTTWQLQRAPLEGSVRLYNMPGTLPLYEDTNYTLTKDSEGLPTGEIVMLTSLGDNGYLSADYRYAGESTGPWPFDDNHANNKAIPGAVLAFGRRAETGDQMAVVVQSRREPAALEYGGRWDISLDFDIITRDVHAQMEITDATVIYLSSTCRSRLSSEGIEILDVNMGGETEEIYDEAGDDYFYNASFSMTIQTDWAIHVPISARIKRVIPQTLEQAETAAGLTDDQLAAGLEEGTITGVENLDIQNFSDPYFRDRTRDYELIR